MVQGRDPAEAGASVGPPTGAEADPKLCFSLLRWAAAWSRCGFQRDGSGLYCHGCCQPLSGAEQALGTLRSQCVGVGRLLDRCWRSFRG